jgi:hypothetical protein
VSQYVEDYSKGKVRKHSTPTSSIFFYGLRMRAPIGRQPKKDSHDANTPPNAEKQLILNACLLTVLNYMVEAQTYTLYLKEELRFPSIVFGDSLNSHHYSTERNKPAQDTPLMKLTNHLFVVVLGSMASLAVAESSQDVCPLPQTTKNEVSNSTMTFLLKHMESPAAIECTRDSPMLVRRLYKRSPLPLMMEVAQTEAVVSGNVKQSRFRKWLHRLEARLDRANTKQQSEIEKIQAAIEEEKFLMARKTESSKSSKSKASKTKASKSTSSKSTSSKTKG